jgi:hypothetical protein
MPTASPASMLFKLGINGALFNWMDVKIVVTWFYAFLDASWSLSARPALSPVWRVPHHAHVYLNAAFSASKRR